MDNWERLILYRKKLVLPRIYQLVDWFSWIACFFCRIIHCCYSVSLWVYSY